MNEVDFDDAVTTKFRNSPVTAPFPGEICVELVDACNLACRTCPRGRREISNKRGQMGIDMFIRVILKVKEIGFKIINLFNWTDPFICKNLPEYAKIVKENALTCVLSSNLSYRKIPDLIATLKYTDHLTVSCSGFYQDTYKINHFGGNINFVKSNLERIAEAKACGIINTEVVIRYFNFPYSKKEFPLFKEFAHRLGMKIVPWKAYGYEKFILPTLNSHEAHEDCFKMIDEDNRTHKNELPLSYSNCFASLTPLILDMYGDVYLCCVTPTIGHYKIGSFLEDDFDLLQYRKSIHPYCISGCTIKSPVVPPLPI